jgi:hypothetical protein
MKGAGEVGNGRRLVLTLALAFAIFNCGEQQVKIECPRYSNYCRCYSWKAGWDKQNGPLIVQLTAERDPVNQCMDVLKLGADTCSIQ